MSYGLELGSTSYDKSEVNTELLNRDNHPFEPIQENPSQFFKVNESTNQLVNNNVLPKLEIMGNKEVDPEKEKDGGQKAKTDKKPSLDRPCPKDEYGKNYDQNSIITPEEACKIRRWIVKQFK